MQYKVLPAPENLPIPKDANGYVMGGVLAETYKGGNLDIILQEYRKHRAVGEIVTSEEKLEPADTLTPEQLAGKEVVEKDGKRFIKTTVQKK